MHHHIKVKMNQTSFFSVPRGTSRFAFGGTTAEVEVLLKRRSHRPTLSGWVSERLHLFSRDDCWGRHREAAIVIPLLAAVMSQVQRNETNHFEASFSGPESVLEIVKFNLK